MLSSLKGDGVGFPVEGEFSGQRIVDIRHLTSGELNVNHGANHAGNTTRRALGGGSSHVSHLP